MLLSTAAILHLNKAYSLPLKDKVAFAFNNRRAAFSCGRSLYGVPDKDTNSKEAFFSPKSLLPQAQFWFISSRDYLSFWTVNNRDGFHQSQQMYQALKEEERICFSGTAHDCCTDWLVYFNIGSHINILLMKIHLYINISSNVKCENRLFLPLPSPQAWVHKLSKLELCRMFCFIFSLRNLNVCQWRPQAEICGTYFMFLLYIKY